MNEQRTTLEKEHAIAGLSYTPRAVSLNGAIYGQLDTETLSLEVFGHSEAGRSEKRLANQDYFYMPVQQPESISSGSFLFAVADGVGGADHSEKASEITVKEILRHYYAFSRYGVNHQSAFTQAAQQAHHIVKREGERRHHTMATTLVAALVPTQVSDALTLDFACVGDSRAFVLRAQNGLMEQITEDSLWYEDEQKRGGEAAEQADTLVKANPRLMQSPRTIGGIGSDLQVDFFSDIPVYPNDIILLCSDGLYKPLGETAGIAPILQQNATDLNAAATLLLNAVRRQGGLDDASLVLMRVVKAGTMTAAPPASAQSHKKTAAAGTATKTAPPDSIDNQTNRMKGWAIAAAVVVIGLLLTFFLWGGDGDDSPAVTAEIGSAPIEPTISAAAGPGDLATATPLLDAYPTNTPAAAVEPIEPSEPAPTTTAPTESPPPTAPPTSEPPPAPEESVASAGNEDSPPTETPSEEESSPAPSPETAETTVDLPPALDCAPGSCKYELLRRNWADLHPGAVYDSPNPFEFGWGYRSLGLDEYYDIRIYDSPETAAPIRMSAVRDRNFIEVPLELTCQEYFWDIRIGSAANITPDPTISGLFSVNAADYTGARSPASGRWPFVWQVACDDTGSTDESEGQ